MNNNPTITVIVPIYKVEKYLHKCIDSIINQTYSELEIILVDDGSPDNCPEICDDYANKDSRIKVIHKANGGLSDARNAGIDNASGEYLMFVDSDDYIEPQMVEILYKALLDNDATISICNYKYVTDNSDFAVDNDNLPIKDGVITGRELLSDIFFGEKSWYWVVAVCKLYRKELFDNIRFPVNKIHEDEFVFHKIILQCQKIACVALPMYNYLQRQGSIMHQRMSLKTLDCAEALFLRAGDLSGIKGFGDAALKFLCFGIDKYCTCYFSADFKTMPQFRVRNRELQKLYRTAANGVLKSKAKFTITQLLKVLGGYFSLYYYCKTIQIVWKITRKT